MNGKLNNSPKDRESDVNVAKNGQFAFFTASNKFHGKQ